MNYILYHDESKLAGYWHGMLLVPEAKLDELHSHMCLARTSHSYDGLVGIKYVRGHNPVRKLATSWMQIGIAGLASNLTNQHLPYHMGNGTYGYVTSTIGAKFILFREKSELKSLLGHPDYGSKMETTFRMGMKGGLHFLGDVNHPIHLAKMRFDGWEHYQRHLDRDRIVGRLSGLREYCSISNAPDVIDDRSSDHTRSDCQERIHCDMLQLTDLLVGCGRSVLGQCTRKEHLEVAAPLTQLIHKVRQGTKRMHNSRWNRSICMSQCELREEGWVFSPLEFAQTSKPRMSHLELFDENEDEVHVSTEDGPTSDL